MPGDEGRLFRRLRSQGGGRNRPCRQPSHCSRQEAVDVGQPRLRLRVGPQSDRTRRAGRISPLHRADGRRVHRQPARFLLSRSRRNQGIPAVLVSDPGDRHGAAGQPRRGAAPFGRRGRHPPRRRRPDAARRRRHHSSDGRSRSWTMEAIASPGIALHRDARAALRRRRRGSLPLRPRRGGERGDRLSA